MIKASQTNRVGGNGDEKGHGFINLIGDLARFATERGVDALIFEGEFFRRHDADHEWSPSLVALQCDLNRPLFPFKWMDDVLASSD